MQQEINSPDISKVYVTYAYFGQ